MFLRLSVTIAGIVVVCYIGLRLIIQRYRMPLKMEQHDIDENELSTAARYLFEEADEILPGLGFSAVKTFAADESYFTSQNKLYYNGKSRTAALVTHSQAAPSFRMWQFISFFEDGTELNTSNAVVPHLPSPEFYRAYYYPGDSAAEWLYRKHLEHMEDLKAESRTPKKLKPKAIAGELYGCLERQMEYLVERRMFRVDEKSGHYAGTMRLGFHVLLDAANPLARLNLSPRTLIGIALALLLSIGSALLTPLSGFADLLIGLLGNVKPLQASYLSFIPGFMLSGLVAGWAARSKGFLWSILVNIPALALIWGTAPEPLFYAVIAAQAGLTGDRIFSGAPRPQGTKLLGPIVILVGLVILGYYFMGGRV